jgi:phosphohistidine phosphatase
MAKTLFLVRHAKSSWSDFGLRDIERTLETRGHNDAPRMAKYLKKEGVQPDLLVSSPAVRAKTTAQYFAKEWGIAESAIDIQRDVYEAMVSDIFTVVRELPDSATTVLLFGHNPTFTDFANRFTNDYIDNVPTCGVVKIESSSATWADFSEKTARLADFWYPKML